MHSLPQEFLALCRQLGDVQKRCSATVAAQAAQLEALQAQVLRLRAELIVRDTRLAMAHDALAQLQAADPGLPRRKALARHMGVLVERIASLSRECLRWRLAAQAEAHSTPPVAPAHSQHAARRPCVGEGAGRVVHESVPQAPSGATPEETPDATLDATLDANLAAADLVICQTGCISHDAYWRVQDHCRRTGKPCILVDQPLAVRAAEALATIQPMVVLRMARTQHPAGHVPADVPVDAEHRVLDKNGL